MVNACHSRLVLLHGAAADCLGRLTAFIWLFWTRQIIEMHKSRLNDFQQERLRRMQAVDQVLITSTHFVVVWLADLYDHLHRLIFVCSCCILYFRVKIITEKDQDKQEAAEKAKAEEAARQSTEQAKKEYQVHWCRRSTDICVLFYSVMHLWISWPCTSVCFRL